MSQTRSGRRGLLGPSGRWICLVVFLALLAGVLLVGLYIPAARI